MSANHKIDDMLPEVRGVYRENYKLSKTNWFQVGGAAEILFKPEDAEDLAHFIKNKPADLEINTIGVGSNIIVRDGGISGVTIKLGRNFSYVNIEGENVETGAGTLDVNVANQCLKHEIGGLEFLSGIPGTIGGALAMNAGAYGVEVKDVLISAQAIDDEGNIITLKTDDIGYGYRSKEIPDSWIFTKALFKGSKKNANMIEGIMNEIAEKREDTQPIRTRTGGSTFKNPDGKKAWELIDEAGCRGLKIGGAKISEKHCNFMENTGDATASDLENLGDEVIKKVKEKTGIELNWEIKRIGNK